MHEGEPRLRHGTPAERARELIANVERTVHGKPEVVERAVVCMIAGGHLLLEDVPGVGKTTLARSLARSIDGDNLHNTIATFPRSKHLVLAVTVKVGDAHAKRLRRVLD